MGSDNRPRIGRKANNNSLMAPDAAIQVVTRQELASLMTLRVTDELESRIKALELQRKGYFQQLKEAVEEAYNVEIERVRPQVNQARKQVKALQTLVGRQRDGIRINGMSSIRVQEYTRGGVLIQGTADPELNGHEQNVNTLISKFDHAIRCLLESSAPEEQVFVVLVHTKTRGLECSASITLKFDFDPKALAQKITPLLEQIKECNAKCSQYDAMLRDKETLERRAMAKLTQQALVAQGKLSLDGFPSDPIKLIALDDVY
jgi:hypothetical protein